MSTLRVSNIEAKADPSSPSVDEKLKFTNSNGDVLFHLDGKTSGITTVGVNTTSATFSVDNNQNVEFLGIVTATKFSLTGGGEITGGDANFTGIVTAGSISVTGNVSVGGTLTYEDVTSIDSIGIITARGDVHVGAGLSVVGVSTLGNTIVGGATTELVVTGNTRVDGSLIVGSASSTTTTTIDGSQDFPTIRPTLDLNFAATKTLDRRITFTRDSIGTYTDELGIIRTAPNNVPRFDHDPETGESLGLLIEESRTNIIRNSYLYNESSYFHQCLRATQESEIGPDGRTGEVTLFYPNTVDTTHYYYLDYLSQTGAHTITAWFKNLTTTIYYPQLRVFDISVGQAFANYDITGDGAVYSTGGVSFTAASIKKYPNGWYRCTMSCNNASAHSMGIVISNSTSAELPSYAGDADSNKGFLVWGVQIENNSFGTSFIPTSGSTVTRAADLAKITGTNFTDFYNSSEGTLFAESSFADLTTENQATVQLWYSSTEHIGMGYRWGASGSGTYGFYIRNTADQLYRAPSGVTSNTFVKASLAYKSNDGASSLNGETAVFDDSINLPTAATEMTIGYGNQTSSYRMKQGHIKQLTYYNKRLTNAQLQSLTRQ